ncbi:hypothetical protein BO94DRAFT_535444 [Aspergillus sclerotioniger CBS 115572]|uniref:Uncharacterized protein n=1 Tax=Aspergillus sclerotioniger CBS 115572 TaxID=1450535 RepID=A0A317WLH2_9EURO|nr:hypothetical protein BO94DRAFT_535444 [Aspergillus sclerotioniger CBS 115572]PWY87324.1 hypothetical protein BO94DRAFT_535444 [Aspergillus sclerotioniger CBS 115572]
MSRSFSPWPRTSLGPRLCSPTPCTENWKDCILFLQTAEYSFLGFGTDCHEIAQSSIVHGMRPESRCVQVTASPETVNIPTILLPPRFPFMWGGLWVSQAGSLDYAINAGITMLMRLRTTEQLFTTSRGLWRPAGITPFDFNAAKSAAFRSTLGVLLHLSIRGRGNRIIRRSVPLKMSLVASLNRHVFFLQLQPLRTRS